MFKPCGHARVFGQDPGTDFAAACVEGLLARTKDFSPAQFARTQIFVNTARMQRRIKMIFDAGPPRLLPRIRLITDLALDPATVAIPAPVSPLRRRLELSQLVAALIAKAPDLAPRAALYDLSDSLATLMDEMQGEGVSPDAITSLDVGDQSLHWDRALRFLSLLEPYFDATTDAPDREARQRRVIETLVDLWNTAPPPDPIIVAGSTGSRGATALFMAAVAKLPQGAIILPGFDFDQSADVWAAMDTSLTFEDHPQFRFRRMMDLTGITPDQITPWHDVAPPNPARNRLISLSLRPAPVTDQWLAEGPALGDLMTATAEMTLVEAANPRAEAETIALRLRRAADEGITAALITPDRMLTRQVAAALDRWNIVPDDSAGTPLALSPPGRFLRHVAALFTTPLTGETLLTLLKHPLCHSGTADRGPHLRHTRDLELHLRRYGPPYPTGQTLLDWADKAPENDLDRRIWAKWLAQLIDAIPTFEVQPLSHHVERHISLATQFSGGPAQDDAGALWDKAAGREAARIASMLQRDADAGGELSSLDYANLFGAIMSDGVVRDRDAGHPNILIWGTLEARVQGADLVILGGMNDGVWPEAPAPDPWLNRIMRSNAGLLLPERRIGLSAHDYQQAVCSTEVWITRAKRTADAETVPSRWVNRLINLLNGLPAQGGVDALKTMRSKGQRWIAMAEKLSSPDSDIDPAPRPSPCPPVDERPSELSVTRIKTLIRDPYAIYAEKVLRLRPLDPLVPEADAPLRGILIHAILERFIKERPDVADPSARARLMEIAMQVLTEGCPWPTIRAQWLARIDRIADHFLAGEIARQQRGALGKTEIWGEIIIPSVDVKITCKADRIDMMPSGEALIYDYKTGVVPTKPVQLKFDKQLLVEAAMVERGAFADIGARPVADALFIGVNAALRDVPAPLDEQPADTVWAGLESLLRRWAHIDRGYTARLALFSKTDVSPYDHLSRFGEWDMGSDVHPVKLV